MKAFLIILTVICAVFAVNGQTQPASAPTNLDFEADKAGQQVSGWRLNQACTASGYSLTSSAENPYKGNFSGLLKRDGEPTGQTSCIVVQSFDAANFRGKRVRFRSAVRTENGGAGKSQMWLRVDRKNSKGINLLGFFDNMDDRPITSDKWNSYDIIGDVSPDAVTLNIGFLVFGSGKTWVDDASFEIIGDAEFITEAPRPLSEKGLTNLIAFTRLLGYVRHFHPSDEAAKTDWESFSINGIRQVENAKSSKELAEKLSSIFKPIAPTISIYSGKKTIKFPTPANATKGLRWKHLGFGTAIPGTYKSERIEIELKNEQLPSDIPNSIKADLGSGISANIPSVVFADSRGTLPHIESNTETKIDSLKPLKPLFSGNDRATRLADIALAWNVFEHFYPYFDEVKVDWSKVLPEFLKMAATDTDEMEFIKTLQMLVARLQDGHGSVNFGNYARSIPPIMLDKIEGKIVVTNIAKPIEGLNIGDAILSINGQPIEQALQEKEKLVSAATEQWKLYRSLADLVGGQKDEIVQLEIEPWKNLGQKAKVSVKCDTAINSINDKQRKNVEEIESGIFYLNIDKISDKDFNDLMPKLEQAKGIIFDFRGYPKLQDPFSFLSHLSDKPMTSPKFLIPLITEPNHQNMKFESGRGWEINPSAPFLKAKKVFITDGRAISYTESILGIVENYKLGEIVGGATAGTNGNINSFQLPGGYRLIFTGMKVQKHDGSQHHGVGIIPTVKVTRTRAGVATGRDMQLETAILELSK